MVCMMQSFFMPPTSKNVNFGEVEGEYWFGPLRACMRASVRPLRFASGQERLEIGS